MDQSPNNPNTNNLRPGITQEQLAAAIRKSGYPLQTVIADKLRGEYRVQEEWSFIDSVDTKALRTMDVLAEKPLYRHNNDDQPRARPVLDLLIECKQSDLPYVFFLSPNKPWLKNFPMIAGLFDDEIEITTDDSRSTWTVPLIHALDLETHPFLQTDVLYSFSFSRCVRKGNDFELSGTDAFHQLVLPIVKALHHFQNHEKPPRTAHFHDCHLALGVAVLDAPIVAVKVEGDTQALKALPWVRVMRHEAIDSEDWTARTKLYAIDIVHKDFFDAYLTQHVEPFAQRFSELVLKHHVEVASGKGFASGLEKTPAKGFETRLRPR